MSYDYLITLMFISIKPVLTQQEAIKCHQAGLIII